MKTILPALLLTLASVFAVEPRPSKYLSGTVSRDVAGALQRAKAAGKPAAVITYDISSKQKEGSETEVEYGLRCFFELPETKRLMAANFIQIMAPWNAAGVGEIRDDTDKTGLSTITFLDKSGSVIARHHLSANPKDALKRVQDAVAKVAGK